MKVIRLHPGDDVAVALVELAAGQSPGEDCPAPVTTVPAGHKLALHAIAAGSAVRKYGQVIGVATRDIATGEHVHVDNLGMDAEGRGGDGSAAGAWQPPAASARTFDGFRRADGRAATRNYVGIITSVNCSATVARHIADRFRGAAMDRWPQVDGVVAITHGSGCGMGADTEGITQLERTLAGFARHPNFAGVLLLGLGCEANQVDRLMARQGLEASDRLQRLVIQEAGGTTATVRTGSEAVEAMLDLANSARREPLPVSELTLGLQCGGSDGLSGITANPALGVAADLLVAHGGTAILSETPEIYGAEHLLIDRAASPEVADALRERISWWEDYAARNDGDLDNNPSPGNKAGGLTTILEKSLGAVAKSGRSPLQGVYLYGEPIDRKGFVFMDSPGYDPMSITGQVASGANLVAFTTGRGSVYGCKPVPSLKLATNTPMFERMRDDMDLNCGAIVDGDLSVEEMGERIFEKMLATASGGKTASEKLGFGDDEFLPWVFGAQM